MSLCLCTLILNEAEHLPKLYEQHRDWPGMLRWVFVESADRAYADANPDLVTPEGLSVDGTTELLEQITRDDSRVIHIKHGFSDHPDPAQGKCAARSRYLTAADEVEPDFLYVVDADEFYCRDAQERIEPLMQKKGIYNAWCFRQRHIWQPPSIRNEPLFALEVVGGFWAIPHCRGWRWQSGLRYASNHNTPETADGVRLDRQLCHYEAVLGASECVHLGFASSKQMRTAKNRYYIQRGEGKTDHRAWYVMSRACFETWRPGKKLPRGAQVVSYTGPIPEAFRESVVPEVLH